MEHVGCLFGHGATPENAFVVGDRLTERQEHWCILRCPECRLLFLSPRPTHDEVRRYYPYAAYQEEFAPAVEDERTCLGRWNRRYVLRKLQRFVEHSGKDRGRLLDVGCGTGNFLAHMRDFGAWDVFGLDINERAVSYAQRRLRVPAVHGTLEDAEYPTDYFDVVSMWNVLEHLHSPLATLREVKRVLRADGLLVLSVPNSASLDARFFGKHWVGLDPPRHLYTFDRVTLQLLLTRAGFRMVAAAHVTGSYHSFISSSLLCLRDRGPRSRWLRTITRRLLPSWPVHVLIYPALKIIEAAGRGAILTVGAELDRSPGPTGAGAPSEAPNPTTNPQ